MLAIGIIPQGTFTALQLHMSNNYSVKKASNITQTLLIMPNCHAFVKSLFFVTSTIVVEFGNVSFEIHFKN